MNYTKMMDPNCSTQVEDPELLDILTKIQEYAESGGPTLLCEIYVWCKSRYPLILKLVIQVMVSGITKIIASLGLWHWLNMILKIILFGRN
jgi:hypothetical protein